MRVWNLMMQLLCEPSRGLLNRLNFREETALQRPRKSADRSAVKLLIILKFSSVVIQYHMYIVQSIIIIKTE